MAVLRLAQYEVLGKLGAGGMGEVFRARDLRLPREVAIKVLPARFAHDPKRLARFQREALAASSLAHPNIVTIHEVGQTEDGLPFIVMELIRGQTLRELMVGRPLLTRHALDLAVQATEGLAKAHAAGIVHRDIKPENIMLSEDGFIKILDFGIAKLDVPRLERASHETATESFPDGEWPKDKAQTAAGAVFGTISYMSPEQARGLVVDFRSDQFSCGATLYEIATGRRAFHRPTAAQTLTAIIEDEPESIATLNPEAPVPFRWIVERCLAKDPAERYASTLDLARELRNVRDRLSEVSTGVGPPAPPPRPRQKWLMAVPAALLVVASLITPVRQAALRWAGFPAVPRERHLAVLPFSESGSAESGNADGGFVEGLADTLTGRLTQLERFHGSLWVVPASEVRQAGISTASAARRTFGVNLVVNGSAQRSRGRLRLTANLVDAETLRQIRSTALDAPISEAAVWQEDVVDHVVNMLDLEIGPEARKALRAGVTQVAGAYELYLQGRSELMHFEDIESIGRAIGLFQRAVQQDPTYALAYAGMGEAYWRRYQDTKELASAELGQKACQKAAELNDLLAPVHVTLGLIHSGTGRHEQAIQDFARALALDPGNVEAWRESAVSREALGRLDEAEATYQKAVALKPDYWAGQNALAGYYYRHGRYAEAAAVYGQALFLAPDNVRVLSNLSAAYQVLDRLPEAQAMLERAVQVRPDPDALSNLASLEFSRKLFEDSARSFEQAVQIRSEDSRLWHNLASAYYWVPGGREKARAAYERAARLAERERSTNPRDPGVLMRLADCNAMIGKATEAKGYAAEGLALAPANVNVMVDAAAIYEHLGERNLALDWLRKALRGGYPPKRLERRQDLAELRTDPRYQSLAGS